MQAASLGRSQYAGRGGGRPRWPGSAWRRPAACSTAWCPPSDATVRSRVPEIDVQALDLLDEHRDGAACGAHLFTRVFAKPFSPGPQGLDLRLVEALCSSAQCAAAGGRAARTLNTLSTRVGLKSQGSRPKADPLLITQAPHDHGLTRTEKKGKKIHRAGGVFVHLPHEPSACAYRPRERFRPTTLRARCNQNVSGERHDVQKRTPARTSAVCGGCVLGRVRLPVADSFFWTRANRPAGRCACCPAMPLFRQEGAETWHSPCD